MLQIAYQLLRNQYAYALKHSHHPGIWEQRAKALAKLNGWVVKTFRKYMFPSKLFGKGTIIYCCAFTKSTTDKAQYCHEEDSIVGYEEACSALVRQYTHGSSYSLEELDMRIAINGDDFQISNAQTLEKFKTIEKLIEKRKQDRLQLV